MKKILFLLTIGIIFNVINTIAQTADSVKVDEEIIYIFAEQMPEFVGGESKMETYFNRNIIYPQEALKNKIEGKVIVTFIIEKDGSTSNIEVVKKLGWGIDEEAIRLISKMPAWRPGKLEGRLVRIRFTLPIVFNL